MTVFSQFVLRDIIFASSCSDGTRKNKEFEKGSDKEILWKNEMFTQFFLLTLTETIVLVKK